MKCLAVQCFEMNTINLSVDVLEWAASSAGESLRSIAAHIASKESVISNILTGQLTVAQVEKFAKKVGVPFGYFFLDAPPAKFRTQIPDLRQTVEAVPLSNNFYDVLDDAKRKQDWFRDHLKGNDAEPLPFVGKFNLQSSAKAIARDISKTLGLNPDDRHSCKTQEEYFSDVSKKSEAAGVLVLKSGIVGASTRRSLEVKEFRGFALFDPIAPLVFVNGRDWEVAWVFTLVHELAHIWLGKSGVSDLQSPRAEKEIEVLCNRVAAEVLTPEIEFKQSYEVLGADLSKIAKRFRVSRLVVARRALSLELIDQLAYKQIANESASAKPKAKESGGNPYATVPVRNSKALTGAILVSVAEQRTFYKEAASLLNSTPAFVSKLLKKQLGVDG
jgi:Zn-dependent peptidase ImmA (M78 family)